VLPEMASRPAVLRTDPQSEPVMALSVSGDAGLRELKELAESVVKRRLEQLDGVAQAAVTGGEEREIRVEVDPRRLESLGVTMDELREALASANVSAPGGTILRGRYRYALRTLGEYRTVDEIARTPVRVGGGTDEAGNPRQEGHVTIGDLARVEDGVREQLSVARHDGSDAVGLLVFKSAGANTVRVAERVEGVLEELRAEFPEIGIEVATSQADFISDSIASVVQALMWGALLAFLVLFLFLRDSRYPVAIALAIPISVVGTFALLDAAGVSLNIMSLGGLALGVGMLVDNSIVVLENIFRHRERGLGAAAAAALGAEEVQGAITASTLTTISVFGPILYVQGVAGELFGALALAVAFSLLCSLGVALTLLPVMASRWGGEGSASEGPLARQLRRGGRALGSGFARLTRRPLDAFDRFYGRVAAGYHRLLTASLAARGRVLASAVLVLALSLGVAALLPRSILPEVDQGAFTVRVELERGTPLEETAALAGRLEERLLADPAVEAVFTRAGQQAAVGGVELRESGLNSAVLDVRLRPGAATAPVVRRLRAGLGDLPAEAIAVETGQSSTLGQLLGGGEADLAVRVRGDDEQAVLAHASAVAERLASERRLTNLRLGSELGQPEYRVAIDRERAASYGIDPRRIARTIETYMLGETATEFVEFDRRVPVVVRLPEAERRRLETLDRLTVDGVPLRELVTTEAAFGPAEILRMDQGRYLPVYADVASGGTAAALARVAAALAELPAPAGVRVEIGGENEEMERTFRDLAFAFALALLLVFMILAAQFESLFHPFTILLSVPLALAGAVAALALSGAGLNTMSLIGVVILVGIVVNDAIIKVDLINQLRARGQPRRAAVIEAGGARLRPILMTTLTTTVGLLPMALGLGRGADLRAPLAIAVIGGLVVATLLTLVVIPVVYELVDDVRLRLTRGGGEEEAEPELAVEPPARPAIPVGV
jgi:hydrophobic/amphiphilic exporter-1 (mainly G- bacteria), HAE1 family